MSEITDRVGQPRTVLELEAAIKAIKEDVQAYPHLPYSSNYYQVIIDGLTELIAIRKAVQKEEKEK